MEMLGLDVVEWKECTSLVCWQLALGEWKYYFLKGIDQLWFLGASSKAEKKLWTFIFKYMFQ